MGALLTIVLVYTAFLVFLYFYQSHLIYFPDTSKPISAEWGAEAAHVAEVRTEDGLNLEGWYFAPQKAGFPVIVYFHGNASHYGGRTDKIRPFLDAGYGVLLAGYRGYGGNPGRPGERGFYDDGRAYMRWLQREHNILQSQIILYGESLGSAVALQMALEYEVAGVVLEAPLSSALDIARKHYFYVPVSLLMKERFDNLEKIRGINAPLFMMHGDHDRVIPVFFGKKLFEAAREPKDLKIIEGGGHNDLYTHGGALHVLKFLSTIDKPRTPGPHQEQE